MFFKKEKKYAGYIEKYHDFMTHIKDLEHKHDDPMARLILHDFQKFTKQVDDVSKGDEFTPSNMFDTNRILLDMLSKDDVFYGVSAIINAHDWAHDPALLKYKEANKQAAYRGVKIKRTFVLQKQSDIDEMRPIMDDQVDMGIDIYYVLENKLKTLSYFPDFTVIPKFSLAVYVPNLNHLKTCVVKRDDIVVEELMNDYKTISRYISKWGENA